MIAYYTPRETPNVETLYVCPETRERANRWMGDRAIEVKDGQYLARYLGVFAAYGYDEFHEIFTYRKRVNNTSELVASYARVGLDKKGIAHALGLSRTSIENHYPDPAELDPRRPVTAEEVNAYLKEN